MTTPSDRPNSAFEEGFVEVNSLQLAYRRWPGSRPENPPFLLLHGLASGLRIWDLVAAQLVEQTGAEIVAVDQRGHGRSDKPDSGYNNPQVVQDDYAVAQHFGLTRPVVVGHSWGATVALAYAATHPAEAGAVVLVDGGLSNMQGRPDWTWERAERELAPPDFAGTPRETFLSFYHQGQQGRFFEPVWSDQLSDMVLNIVELRSDDTVGPRLSRANHMQILRSMWDSDNYALARQVTCPVLLISAEPVPADTPDAELNEWLRSKREGGAKMQAVLTSAPHVEFRIMSETVHDIPLQRPAELAATLVQFCRTAGLLPTQSK